MRARVKISVGCLVCLLLAGDSARLSAETDQSAWQVGLAQTKITPEEPIWMAGYASRNKPSEGVLRDLYAKAMALEDGQGNRAVLLTADVIGYKSQMAAHVCDQITEQTGLERSQILLAPAHTHTGPVISIAKSNMYVSNPEQADRVHQFALRLADELTKITVAALKDLQPARLSWGIGVTNIVMNRREPTERGIRLGFNPSGYVDRSVPVLRIDAPDGKPRCLLFGCACHNTTLTGQHYELSGDYAGFAQQQIEQENPGVQAMFMIGCAGSANPYPRGTVDAAKQNGQSLGAEVCRVAAGKLTPVNGPLQANLEFVTLPLAPVPSKERLEDMAKGPSYLAYNARQMLEMLDKGEKPPSEYTTPFAVWQFGKDLTLVALPGEVVNGYVPLIQQTIGPRKLWISAYANDCFGYVPTARVLAEGGYETRCLYTAPGFFPPEVEQVVLDTVQRMTKEAGREVQE